ncbi:hypothetical protein B0H66DRAFT_394561 [Apodospora peruviana]|uniref:Uncharacterized protein n=1 Tax=Apodospora peruviana TaxID=516989 RepID=A0AAE0HT33_9PEZI|nr:hypothetical protein B0H66DRAFT_394561 [Apodospora peruviana]
MELLSWGLGCFSFFFFFCFFFGLGYQHPRLLRHGGGSETQGRAAVQWFVFSLLIPAFLQFFFDYDPFFIVIDAVLLALLVFRSTRHRTKKRSVFI